MSGNMQVPSSSRDASTHIKSVVQHGRTDGRTNEELLTARNHLTVSNAHTRVQRFNGFGIAGSAA